MPCCDSPRGMRKEPATQVQRKGNPVPNLSPEGFSARKKDSRRIVVSPYPVRCGREDLNLHSLLRELGPEPSASANSATAATSGGGWLASRHLPDALSYRQSGAANARGVATTLGKTQKQASSVFHDGVLVAGRGFVESLFQLGQDAGLLGGQILGFAGICRQIEQFLERPLLPVGFGDD